MQQFALKGCLLDIRCHSAEESSNFLATLNGVWAEFKTLGEIKPQATRKAALQLEIKDTLPQSFA